MYNQKSNTWTRHIDFIILDIVALIIAFYLSTSIKFGSTYIFTDIFYRDALIFSVLMSFVVGVFFNTYRKIVRRSFANEIFMTFKHVALVGISLIFYLFILQQSILFSRSASIYILLFYFIFDLVLRSEWKKLLRYRRNKSGGNRAMIVITTKNLVEQTVIRLKENNYEGLNIVGLSILDVDMAGKEILGFPVVANKANLAEYVCHEWVDEVFIKDPTGEYADEEFVEDFVKMGVTVHMKLGKMLFDDNRSQHIETIGSYNVLTTSVKVVTKREMFFKRTIDIIAGIVGTVITGILFIFLAPAIYIKSPGPIFFSQVRLGKNGRKFKIYKFRSMYMDAEERKKEMMAENKIKDGMMFKLDWDKRIIGSEKGPDKGLGNFIRKFSLDEFPQFINVLKGDMSLIGTRPPTMDEWVKYELHHRKRLAIKPGLTGMWQVSGRSSVTDFEEVVKLDTKYITEWNMLLDIKILFKTIAVVLKKDGAM